ncbi:MAG: ATP-dependent DNA helicase RecG [Candidatus Zixiibacteriota bacterium]
MSLNLDSSVQYVKGIGPRKAAALETAGIKTVADLLGHFPRGYLDRSNTIPIGKIARDAVVTIVGRVMAQGSMYGGRHKRFEIVLGDDTGHVSLLWFRGHKYFENRFKKGDILAATGLVTWYNGFRLAHPEIEPLESEDAAGTHTGRIVPLYPSTAELTKVGLHSRGFRKAIRFALESCAQDFEDQLPVDFTDRLDLPRLSFAMRQIHFPDSEQSRESARRRMSFEELAELQFLVLRHKSKVKEIKKSHLLARHGATVKKFASELPFQLTGGQREALKLLYADMAGEKPMNRLLQGDVGCGKTVVAVAAAVYAAENKLQSAFMAPTELLAEQHQSNWKETLSSVGVTSALLTGSLKSAERKLLVSRIASGKVDIVFGTHALFSADVEFSRLGLVVIDEQHRFGVAQRARLIDKGQAPDVLVMSATPIPRTLALTVYGDLEFATITDLPPGRKLIKTVWRRASEREKIYKFIAERVANREQVFIVYPLALRSENTDLLAAEEAHRELSENVFQNLKVDIIHGQLPVARQEKTIRAFAAGDTDILIATTVVEVGVDIPGATVMVVEHAERFGLAQLHQLRGRVGRADNPAYAVAVATAPVSDVARKRMNFLVSHSDGFEIAEADLKLRGPGEMFGLRQSGALNFRLANLSSDQDLLLAARELIQRVLDKDSSSPNDGRIVEYYAARSALRDKIAAVA